MRDPEVAFFWREEADELIRVVLAAPDPLTAWHEVTGVPAGECCDDVAAIGFFASIRRAARSAA